METVMTMDALIAESARLRMALEAIASLSHYNCGLGDAKGIANAALKTSP